MTHRARQPAGDIQISRVVGVAAVLPAPKSRASEEDGGGDRSAIKRAAMGMAPAHERAFGTVEDVSMTGVGYDIRGEPRTGENREIEVEGHPTRADVTLYVTKWRAAHRMRDELHTYSMKSVPSEPRLSVWRHPVGKGIEPVDTTIENRIPADVLMRYAVPVN